MLACCREQTHISNRGAFVGKKSAFLLSFSATVEMSRVNRYCTTVIICPCGPSPPVLGSISEVWLAAASRVERSGTGLEITGSFPIVSSISNQRDKQAKKQTGFTSADNSTVPIPVLVHALLYYFNFFPKMFCHLNNHPSLEHGDCYWFHCSTNTTNKAVKL